MKRIQAYEINSERYGKVTIVSLGEDNYLSFSERSNVEYGGTLSECLQRFDIKIPCESCDTKIHVGAATMGNKLYDRYLCLSCSTKNEFKNLTMWSVLDHQRAL